jgi:hypothetical protein
MNSAIDALTSAEPDAFHAIAYFLACTAAALQSAAYDIAFDLLWLALDTIESAADELASEVLVRASRIAESLALIADARMTEAGL